MTLIPWHTCTDENIVRMMNILMSEVARKMKRRTESPRMRGKYPPYSSVCELKLSQDGAESKESQGQATSKREQV